MLRTETIVAGGKRRIFEYDERTPQGEKIAVELTRIDLEDVPETMKDRWRKQGSPKAYLPSYWAVDVYAYVDGMCFGRYNPTVRIGGYGYVVDESWVLEATEDNLERLLEEIERRAFGIGDIAMQAPRAR